MSSTGVRDSNSIDKRVIKGLILNEAQFIQSLRVFANTSTLSGLGATEGEINNSPIEASGNYLSRLGDKMLGPLALAPPLDFTIEIDTNNTIDIGPLNDNAQYTSNVQLDDIQPNSFVLDIIANAAFDGQLLFLRTFAPSSPFTISQGTLGNGGNIQTGDGNDLTVGDLQVVTLIFDEALKIEANTGGSWRILSVSSGGGSGSQTPWIQPINGAGFTLIDAGNITIKNTQTDGAAANLILERNDATPLDGDTLGNIFYNGPTDIAAIATWASITVEALDVSNSAKQGELTINVQHDNSLAPIINYTGDDATFRFSSGVDIVRPNVNGTKEFGTSSFYWDDVFSETFTLRGIGGNTSGLARTIYADAVGMIFNMPSSAPIFTHSVNNEIVSRLSNGELEIRTELVDGPTLRLRNNDQTPTSNDIAATILFTGETNTLAEAIYGAIEVTMDDVGNTSKQAQLKIQAQKDNALLNIFDYTGGDATLRISSAVDVMRPNVNGSKELGNASFFWDDVFTETISFRGSGGDTDATKRTIYADAGGINMNVPAFDSFTVLINNIRGAEFNINGPIFNSTTTNHCNAFFSAANKTPVTDGLITSLFFQGLNSVSSSHNYAAIQFRTPDTTNASEDGQIEFQLSQNGLGAGDVSSVNILELNSSGGIQQIGFFGTTPTAKPTVTGSRSGNVALASLLNDLVSLGLIVDATIV